MPSFTFGSRALPAGIAIGSAAAGLVAVWVAVLTAAQQSATPTAPQIATGAGVNPTTLTIDRNQCVTLFLAEAADAACGGARIVHALPTLQALNRSFTPVLVYSSEAAEPGANVRVNVTLPAGATVPDSVTASLSLGGAPAQRRKWSGSHWAPGQTRRIVARATHPTTGLVSYALTVTNWYGATPHSTNGSGSVLVVSRAASPFGSGWWLAGLEELRNVGSAQMLWVGGDGSIRAYNQISSTLWRGVNRVRPDSILYEAATSQYVRHAPQNVQIRFNTAGQHVQTRDRNAVNTSFSWVSGRLDRITLPSGSTSRFFQFNYTGGYLTSVAAHGRTTQVVIASQRINTITDPDALVTTFTYANPSSKLVQFREVGGGGTRTEFVYTPANHVSFTRRFLAAAPHIETSYRHQESQGLLDSGVLKPARLDSVHTWIDGPRSAISDTTRFYVNEFGEPDSVREPLGALTRVLNRNATFPALPTRIRFANGRAVTAVYDTRGRMTSTTDSARVISGVYATTTFLYANPTCPDFATRITRPEGDYIQFGYTATCNRQWQEDNRGVSGRINFGYLPDGRLQKVTPPLSAFDSLAYDPALGNLATEVRAGVTNTWQRDAWGAPTLVNLAGMRFQRTHYDAAGRDTLVIDSAGSTKTVARKRYGQGGLLLSLKTLAVPDMNAIDTITHNYQYDRVGRMTQDRIAQAGGQLINYIYDAAGNLINGGPRPAARTYDANNRMLTEGSGTYLSSFGYDAVGNMTRADNNFARVRRGYSQAGDMVADTQWVAPFNTTTRLPNAFVVGANHYVLRYRYDLNGRVRWQHHSSNLAPAAGQDSITWTFTTAGLLQQIRDVAGNLYVYTYDNEARPNSFNRQLAAGGWVRDSLSYDTRSRVTRHVLRTSASGTPLLLETPAYDNLDRMTADVAKGETYNYMALGPLVHVSAGSIETFDVDPLARRQSANSKIAQFPAITNYFYNAHVGTLRLSEHWGMQVDTTTYLFNQYGQRQYDEYKQRIGLAPPDRHLILRNEYVYNPLFELRSTVYRADSVYDGSIPYPLYQPYRSEEGYWYDALGRRILTWAWKQSNCPSKDAKSGCRNTVTRTVWAGQQIAYEIRAPWTSPNSDSFLDTHHGPIGYLHTGDIDRPVALWKGTQLVHPHLNSRGVFPFGTCGTAQCAASVEFIGNRLSAFGADRNPPPNGPVSWHGNLIRGQLDASGLLYRRNRYADPLTGTFTQADPIGTLGGLNVFAYAGGDPVTFTDPFGLCPVCIVVFEVGASLYDAVDLAATGARYLGGRASGIELSATAAGAATGIVGFGGGYGRAARSLVRESASDPRLWRRLAFEELRSDALRTGGGRSIAGAGAVGGRAVDDINRLVSQHGGNAGDWAKMVGDTRRGPGGLKQQAHWYENVRTSQRVDFKPVFDY